MCGWWWYSVVPIRLFKHTSRRRSPSDDGKRAILGALPDRNGNRFLGPSGPCGAQGVVSDFAHIGAKRQVIVIANYDFS